MKTLLCFGDSNTWGYVPGPDGDRYPPEARWTGILQAGLGDGFRVIEEGLNGRTTVWDDPFEPGNDKKGKRHLPIALESHKPIELVVLMLGTNDLKHHLGLGAADIAFGAGVLVDMILASNAGPAWGAPQVLLVSPARIAAGQCPFWHLFDKAEEISKGFAPAYRGMAEERGVAFLDAAEHVECSRVDCIHLDDSAHRDLGRVMVEKVREIL